MYIMGGFPNTVRIGTDDNILFLENNILKLFLMTSGREYWIRQVYKMRDINGKYHEAVCHKLLQPGKVPLCSHVTPDTSKYISTRNQEWLIKPIDVRKCTQTVNKVLNTDIT
jgi:hypothetical protein